MIAHKEAAHPVGQAVDLRRVLRLTAMAVAFLGAIYIALGIPSAGLMTKQGSDAFNYWNAHLPNPYVGVEGGDTFLYSPVAAFVAYPFTLLSWPLFHVLYAALNASALLWLAGPWALPLLLFPPVTFELWLGQVHLLMAVALVLGFRYPAAWAAILLTKVTPGVGLLWFLVRREWRSLGIALGVTLALSAVSFVVAPHLWAEWIAVLRGSTGAQINALTIVTVPLLPRLVLAGAIVVFGARTDRRWVIPIAAVIALPTVWTFGASMLVACIPLRVTPPTRPS